MLIYSFSLITRNPVFGVTTRYEIAQTVQMQRKTSLEKLDTLYHLSNEQEMKALIRLCRWNRLICAFDVRKGIKQVSLWPGSIYFYCLQGWAKGAHATPHPLPTPPTPQHCRIMIFLGVQWVSCWGSIEFATPLYPYPTQYIYICMGVVAEGTGRLSKILHG